MPIRREHRALLWAVCMAQFFMPFMLAGVNAVLPPMGEDLHASARQLGLIGMLYSLGLASFQLSAGTLGDIWGRKRIFLIGLGLFSLCTFFLGISSSIHAFLGLRFVQALGCAMFNTGGLALVASAASDEERPVYLGLNTAVIYAGIACGPPVAGFVAGVLGWRSLFFLSAVISALICCFMLRFVRLEWRVAANRPFDWRGCLVFGGSMFALSFGTSGLGTTPVLGWILLGLSVLMLCWFALVELHAEYPLLDLRLLARNRVFTCSSLAAFMNYSSFFGMMFFFSIYLQVVRGMGVQEAGLYLAFQAVVQAMATPMATRLCRVWNAAPLSALGVALCGVGLLVALFLDVDSSLCPLFISQFITGVGVSFFAMPNTTIMLASAGREHLGQVSGLSGAMRNCGQLCNMTIITLTLTLFLGNEAASAANVPAFMHSMRMDVLIFAALNLVAVGLALARRGKGQPLQ